MCVAARVDARHEAGWFLAVAAMAIATYAVATWTVMRAAPSTRHGLWICVALAVVCRVPLVVAEPTLSDDIYRYVWDGRIQRFGHSPYVSAPADPALDSLHVPVTRLTSYPQLPTIYPPMAQWCFRAVASISESVLAFKLAFVACDLLVVLLLLRWLTLAGHSPWRVLVYAWNPLVLLEVAGSGHVDALGALLLFASYLAFAERLPMLAAVSFVAAVEVKFLPVVLAPLFWRRIRVRDAAVAGVVGFGLAWPFLGGALQAPIGSLPTYLEHWRFNGPAFAAIESLVAGRWVTLVPALAGLAVAMCVRTQAASPWAWAWPMGVALVLMPAVYPWYLVWLAPFLVVLETAPLLVWTQSVLGTYIVWRIVAAGGAWRLPWWVLVLEYGTALAAAVWVVWIALRTDRWRSSNSAADRGAG
jgi:hypothetical protein